jgi:hypothetical protein
MCALLLAEGGGIFCIGLMLASRIWKIKVCIAIGFWLVVPIHLLPTLTML